MANLNKVMLIGNLTRDPELRHTAKGTAVSEIGLAINRTWSNDQGIKQEDTTFVDVSVWGKQAELIQQYVVKGNPIYIEGRLQLDTWDDKATGQKRSKMRVICENFQFLPTGKPNTAGGGGNYSERPQQSSSQPAQRSGSPQGASPAPMDDYQEEDEIPF